MVSVRVRSRSDCLRFPLLSNFPAKPGLGAPRGARPTPASHVTSSAATTAPRFRCVKSTRCPPATGNLPDQFQTSRPFLQGMFHPLMSSSCVSFSFSVRASSFLSKMAFASPVFSFSAVSHCLCWAALSRVTNSNIVTKPEGTHCFGLKSFLKSSR